MEENVRKELDTLETIVKNWKSSYQGLTTGEENDEALIEDFNEEISTLHIYPFIYRLFEAGYITDIEALEFMNKCYGHLASFIEEVKNGINRR